MGREKQPGGAIPRTEQEYIQAIDSLWDRYRRTPALKLLREALEQPSAALPLGPKFARLVRRLVQATANITFKHEDATGSPSSSLTANISDEERQVVIKLLNQQAPTLNVSKETN